MTVKGEAEDTTTETGENKQTTIQGASEAEKLLQSLGIDLTKLQFGNVQSQSTFQDFLNQQSKDLFSPEALGETEALAQSAGQISSDEEAMIRQIEEYSLASGESDINRYTTEGLDFLKERTAPSRGLRFGDTPILDRGGEIVGEGVRQKAQLGRDVYGRGAKQRLDYPLERQKFQESLRENSRRYRLGLTQTAGELGLGLSGQGDLYGQQKLFLSDRLAQPSVSTQTKEDERRYKADFEGTAPTPTPTPTGL